MNKHFKARHDYFNAGLNGLPGFKVLPGRRDVLCLVRRHRGHPTAWAARTTMRSPSTCSRRRVSRALPARASAGRDISVSRLPRAGRLLEQALARIGKALG